jgi:2,3-dihydro-2,3-dihydroxybenzoate dehydrogenase
MNDSTVMGKVALVTGAAQGLGEVMSRALVEAGALVAGMDIRGDGLARVGAALNGKAAARAFLPIAGDVSSPADSARALAGG